MVSEIKWCSISKELSEHGILLDKASAHSYIALSIILFRTHTHTVQMLVARWLLLHVPASALAWTYSARPSARYSNLQHLHLNSEAFSMLQTTRHYGAIQKKLKESHTLLCGHFTLGWWEHSRTPLQRQDTKNMSNDWIRGFHLKYITKNNAAQLIRHPWLLLKRLLINMF